jgi:hypothetical protein
MGHPRLSNEEIVRRGEELYTRNIRSSVEDKYDGKVVVIDVETGDYEIDDDALQASHRLQAKHPGAALYAVRVGYDDVYGFAGGPQRIKR